MWCTWAFASFLHLMWSKSRQAQHEAVQAAILSPGLSPALPKVSDARLSPIPAGEPMRLITFWVSWATRAISSHKLSAHQRLIGQSRTSHSASSQADHSHCTHCTPHQSTWIWAELREARRKQVYAELKQITDKWRCWWFLLTVLQHQRKRSD